MNTIAYTPQSMDALQAALRALTPQSKQIAGGTDLVVQLKESVSSPDALLYLGAIPELCEMVQQPDGVLKIGAACTMKQIESAVKKLGPAYAVLSDAAGDVGSAQIRNRATIGGNIANASPAADLLPVLWLLNASVQIATPETIREVPLCDLMDRPGKIKIAHNESIITFYIPPQSSGTVSAFVKVGNRKRVTISRVGLAMQAKGTKDRIADVKIVLGAVAKTPVRAETAEQLLCTCPLDETVIGQAGSALSAYILEVNQRANRFYKAASVQGIFEDALIKLQSRLAVLP